MSAELDKLRTEAREALQELEEADDWDFEERTQPAIHVHLPKSSKAPSSEPSTPQVLATLPPKARLIAAIVLAILTALGAVKGL